MEKEKKSPPTPIVIPLDIVPLSGGPKQTVEISI